MIFAFDNEPPIGTIVRLDDQPFELVRTEPYQRKDGGKSWLLHWLTACPVCGDHFEQTSPLATTSLVRRCEQHRKPGKPVKGKRGRRLKSAVEMP